MLTQGTASQKLLVELIQQKRVNEQTSVFIANIKHNIRKPNSSFCQNFLNKNQLLPVLRKRVVISDLAIKYDKGESQVILERYLEPILKDILPNHLERHIFLSNLLDAYSECPPIGKNLEFNASTDKVLI